MMMRFSRVISAAGWLYAAAALGQPLAIFTFDDGTATDLSGAGHNGILVGTPLFVGGGFDGGGIQFSGTNAIRLNIDINPAVHPQITMGAWINSSLSTPVRHLLSHDNQGYDRDVCIDTRGGGTGWTAFKGTGVVGYVPAKTGEWQFVAAVYDDTAGTVTLYVDGQVRTASGRPGVGNTFMYVGRSTCCDAGVVGIVDNVFVLPEALSIQRLDEIWAGGIRRVPTCPLFLKQPQPVVVCSRATATLSVDGAGAGTMWAIWQHETAPGSNVFHAVVDGPTGSGSIISGSFTANLHIEYAGIADLGRYRCVLTNDCGSVPSDAVELSICSANYNCDDAVDFFDYLDFVSAFAGGSILADFNEDQVVDFFDYLDFIAAFASGC